MIFPALLVLVSAAHRAATVGCNAGLPVWNLLEPAAAVAAAAGVVLPE